MAFRHRANGFRPHRAAALRADPAQGGGLCANNRLSRDGIRRACPVLCTAQAPAHLIAGAGDSRDQEGPAGLLARSSGGFGRVLGSERAPAQAPGHGGHAQPTSRPWSVMVMLFSDMACEWLRILATCTARPICAIPLRCSAGRWCCRIGTAARPGCCRAGRGRWSRRRGAARCRLAGPGR